MGNLKALSFKMMVTGLPLFLVLGLFGAEGWWSAFIAAIIVGAIAYLVGDMMILPSAGNLVATIADAGLVFAILYAFRLFGIEFAMYSLWIAAGLTLLSEGLIVHPYLNRLVTQDSMGPVGGDRE